MHRCALHIGPMVRQVGVHKVTAMLNGLLIPGCPFTLASSATEVCLQSPAHSGLQPVAASPQDAFCDCSAQRTQAHGCDRVLVMLILST